MARMSTHTHDDVDWASRLSALRRFALLEHEPLATVAARLTEGLGEGATVVDVGCGAGGMSSALAAALQRGGGGTMVLVDAVDEVLAAAQEAVTTTLSASSGAGVSVETVLADAGTAELRDLVPAADVVWASAVVHHLPDQQAAITRLADALRSGGLLAVAEGGLETRCLPWDLGVGRPGLEQRLNAGRDEWFGELRATMPDAVRMPYGWTAALGRAGLAATGSFGYLIDHPAPAGPFVREFAVERVEWLSEAAGERLDPEDREAVQRLLDSGAPEYVGTRDDIYLLSARTVHHGRRP